MWSSGYVLNVTVTNNANSAINSWRLDLNFNKNPNVSGPWSANISTSGNTITATNVSDNGNINSGQSTSFGLQGTYNGSWWISKYDWLSLSGNGLWFLTWVVSSIYSSV